MKGKRNAGFSLIEVVVAMAILAVIVIPICGSMVVAVRINAKAEAVLNARVAVSSAVETLRSEGIQTGESTNVSADRFENVTIVVTEVEGAPYYNVEVTDKDGLVTVTTSVRAVEEAGDPQ